MAKKDRSNPDSIDNREYTLPRGKILRGRKNFSRLFQRDARILRGTHVDLRYKIVDETTFGCLMGFIVKTSLGKAHKRNHMKRLLREAYRHRQYTLSDPLRQTARTLHGALMARTIEADYRQVEQDVKELLAQARDELPTISSGDS